MDGFRLPQTIPQDLLLIQEYVDIPKPVSTQKPSQLTVAEQDDADIASSGSESDVEDDIDSEDEIAADLTKDAVTDEENTMNDIKTTSEPSDTSSESSSESSEDEEDAQKGNKKSVACNDFDDDDDPVQAPSGNYFTTKNELVEGDVVLPEVDEVGPDEVLEKVGEIMTIVDHVVIIRGLPSEYLNRASERALDSDTLLVFDDRKVVGYIYETFGPTMQPLYQIKFNSTFPLNPERVTVGREVFHVPARSRFVFVSQIRAYKGSDASNVHDEEPADDELEFSDDEVEATYKSRIKRKRAESRSRSVTSSRASTPNPSLMRDQELADDAFLNRNAYDEHGPYDIDYTAPSSSSFSRPTPIPYDDPYGEAYTAPDVADSEVRMEAEQPRRTTFDHDRPPRGRGRGRGRGDTGYQRDRGRGRGQGRGRGRDRGSQRHHESRQMSPTSMAIARVTAPGSYPPFTASQQEYSPMYSVQPGNPSFIQPQQDQHHYAPPLFMQQVSSVQPHINPRFANAYGLAMYPQNTQPQDQGYSFGQSQQQSSDTSHWMNTWSTSRQAGYPGGEDSKNSGS
ncbi:Gar1/Naf1 RNA binding region-domain-containing protein [Crepidotus variabilis]|uniref:H/ACA ribonucleoprotein complex non-core subunit NAF1 n=1 Tax=Crepidotus variabilis TaxID=179855 RepID=A0A9P6EN97_9AGAR|nr:Gar1/Naf1 RNA binding region-domain-containing protein [Crepidotus variabilis]